MVATQCIPSCIPEIHQTESFVIRETEAEIAQFGAGKQGRSLVHRENYTQLKLTSYWDRCYSKTPRC